MGISAYARFETAMNRASQCAHCGEGDFEASAEAFDLEGEIVCETCAEPIIEAHSQFGVGA